MHFDGIMLILALALAVFVGGFLHAYFRNDPLEDASQRLAAILSPAALGNGDRERGG